MKASHGQQLADYTDWQARRQGGISAARRIVAMMRAGHMTLSAANPRDDARGVFTGLLAHWGAA